MCDIRTNMITIFVSHFWTWRFSNLHQVESAEDDPTAQNEYRAEFEEGNELASAAEVRTDMPRAAIQRWRKMYSDS